MSPEEQQNDMSMEDILSSIKDILENDGQEKTTAEILPSEPEDVTSAVSAEFQSVEPNKEDDVFDLSKAMIVDDASQEGDSKIELDEIGPDFDITPKEDEPLLAPDDMVLPDFKNEAFDEDNEKSVVQEDVMASSESEKMPEDDFSFNIDEILQSASEAMSEDSEMSSNENIEQSGSDNIEDNIFDVSDIDITSDPIFEQENNSFMDFVSEEQTDAENILTAEDDIQQSEFDDSFLEEKTEDISSVSQINEIPAAVDEDPQEIPEAEFSEVEEISIPEEEPSEVPEEQSVDNNIQEEQIVEIPVEEDVTIEENGKEKEDATDVSADIINNFAKMFAEQAQEHSEKTEEPTPEISTAVSGMGNANKTIEQVVEGVIQGIVASSVNAEMAKNVDIVAYAQKEIHAQTRAWLEANLPAIVEATVQKEIERVMAKVGK